MKAALRLFLVRGLGLRSANGLIKHFKEPERVFQATTDELGALDIPPEIAEDILSPKSAKRAEIEVENADKLGITIIDILDARYPPLLREIFDPPIVLYLRGKKWNAELPQLAIVGTRRPTGYGLNCAERLAEDLAARGLAITSGLARGLDAAAHRGALRAGISYAVFCLKKKNRLAVAHPIAALHPEPGLVRHAGRRRLLRTPSSRGTAHGHA